MAGEDDSGDESSSTSAEYCSLSDRIVTPDSAIGFICSSDAILGNLVVPRSERALGQGTAVVVVQGTSLKLASNAVVKPMMQLHVRENSAYRLS
jgi:hypothetical protein